MKLTVNLNYEPPDELTFHSHTELSYKTNNFSIQLLKVNVKF